MLKSKMNPNQLITTTLLTEIVFEILLKLPVESLLRCKSVCKEWYSLISDHHFIKRHYTLSSTNNINFEHHRLIYNTHQQVNDLNSCPIHDVLFHKSVNNELVLENPFQLTRPQEVRIVGSCNGLACLLAEDDNTLCIYNPSTRTTNSFPGSKQGAGSLWVPYGFGYDETTHDYKVVKLWRCDQTLRGLGVMIYSLKAGSWKEIGHYPRALPLDDGKFLNGALHWVIGDGRSQDIVSLDLGKETYGDVLSPPYDEGSKELTLGVLGEWLCVLRKYDDGHVVDVWVMKVYGVEDSWTKLLSISHPNDRFSIPSYMQFHDLFCISNDGKLLLQLGYNLVVYDRINGSHSMIQNFHGFRDACIVVESLISPFAPLGLGDNKCNEN